MRIISKNKDFYDFVQKWGQDPAVVWNREEDIISISTDRYKQGRPMTINNGTVDIPSGLSPMLIKTWETKTHNYRQVLYAMVFCGEVHPFLKTYSRNKETLSDRVSEIIVDPNAVSKIVREECEQIKKRTWWRWNDFLVSLAEMDELNHHNSLMVVHKEINSPVFMIRHNTVFKNYYSVEDQEIVKDCNLEENGFASRFNPEETFQKISSYLSGVMRVNEPDTQTISDEKMKEKKGFYEWSFKKKPTKKN